MKIKQITIVVLMATGMMWGVPTMASDTCYCNSGKGTKVCSCTDKKCKKGPCVKEGSTVGGSSKATQTCAKNQWYDGKKCQACPTGGSCDGKTVKCAKNFNLVGNQCLCAGAIYKNACYPCPKNGVCDGKGSWKCQAGYTTGTHCSGCGNVWHKDHVKPSCEKLKEGDGSVSTVNTNGKTGCPKNTYHKGKSCEACPKGARCNGVNVEGCVDGYGWDHSAQFPNYCFKCSKGAKNCQKKDGKVVWTSCDKGYHWPWVKKGGMDSTRCVKDSECTIQNPC